MGDDWLRGGERVRTLLAEYEWLASTLFFDWHEPGQLFQRLKNAFFLEGEGFNAFKSLA
jgi:hypothetical protein